MNAAEWTERAERGSEWWLRIMLRITNFAGRRMARLLLWPIAAFFWLRTPAARADSAHYLTRVLGRPAGWRDTYRHYVTFSATILDRIFFLSGRQDEFDIQIVGEEHLLALLGEKKGVFLVGAHIGSLESLRAVGLRHLGRRVAMAMFEENAQKIGRFLRAIDPTLRDDIVALGRSDSMLVINDRLDRGDMVGLLADRSFGKEATVPVLFLGHEAPFPSGVFRMASVLRCPVVAMAGLYLGGNRYQLHFARVADFLSVGRGPERQQAIASAVHAYAAHLERFCHLAPYNWFNFYDFWKAANDTAPTSAQLPSHGKRH